MIKTPFESLFFFDVETVGIYDTLEDCEKNNPTLAKLFRSNFKWFAQRYSEDKDLTESEMFSKRAALVPEFSKVIVFAYQTTNNSGEVVRQVLSSHDEKSLLEKIKIVLERANSMNLTLCGHNAKSFDAPLLSKRMITQGIKPPTNLPTYDVKPWDSKFVDTKEFWGYGYHNGPCSLETVCYSVGVESPKNGDIDGSKVHYSYWTENRLDDIGTYCMNDVVAVAEIVKKLQSLK